MAEGGRLQPLIGHVIGGFFGVAFVFANSGSLPEGIRDLTVAAAAAVSLLSVAVLGRSRREASATAAADERFDRTFLLIVVIEGIALFGGLALLDRPSANVAWIALVVGLHFFWLARLWRRAFVELTVVATLLTVLGVAGLVISFTADSRDAVALLSGVGSGVVLLGSTLHGAISHRSAASGGPGQPLRAK
jgi:hypothetical protein